MTIYRGVGDTGTGEITDFQALAAASAAAAEQSATEAAASAVDAADASRLTVGTTTTGAAGTNAEVTITGVAGSQLLNLTIPRGDTGATGATGSTGADGKTILSGSSDPTSQGVNGDYYINTTTYYIFGPKTSGSWGTGVSLVGPQGIQGIQGIQGEQGEQGIQGIQGVKGDTGSTGATGATGNGIASVIRTSGTGAPGTTDTYTITFTDTTTTTFTVYNGADGEGSGSVTSVGMSVPTGLSVSGSPVTTSGTLALTYASGYSIPTTTKQGQWDTAYGWGNHASAGYLTSSAIGTTVQAYDADLTSWAAIAPSAKQDALVSGTNIKTVNGTSLLGSGDVGTIDVSHGGTGATSLTANNVLLGNGTSALQTVAPGTSGNVLTSNGSTWISSAPSGGGGGSLLRETVFTSSGTWTKGANTEYILVQAVGGGGGGAGGLSSPVYGGGGGAAGGYAQKFIDVTSVSTIDITIGSGGSGGVVDGSGQAPGGTTTVGSYITCIGGNPGGQGASPPARGTGSGGDINIQGGGSGGSSSTGWGTTGGSSYFGGGGGGALGNGQTSTCYGAGGGGGGQYGNGGTGASGIVIIMEYA